MKKIAIIGANSFQNPLILKAKELGYETHVFAWQCGDIGEKTADFFYPISIIDEEMILEKCKEIGIDAITTIASDLATRTVNYVADKMNLPGNSLRCTEISTNKFLMRKAFKEHGVETPEFMIITQNELDTLNSINDIQDKLGSISLPCIVKPTDRSGSRAITKVTRFEDLKEAVNKAIENSFENKAIIEEYLTGNEFSIEGITYQGHHNFLTVTRKATTGAPHFIETGHIEPAGLTESMISKIESEVSKALDALEVTNSATHAEFRITDDGDVRIIEIGARMGGDCIGSDLVQISTGFDFVKMVIDVALGNAPDFKKINEPKIAVIRFIMNQQDYQKLDKVKKECPELIYYVSDITKDDVHQVVDSSSRYGYYILACDNKDKIRWLLNEDEQY